MNGLLGASEDAENSALSSRISALGLQEQRDEADQQAKTAHRAASAASISGLVGTGVGSMLGGGGMAKPPAATTTSASSGSSMTSFSQLLGSTGGRLFSGPYQNVNTSGADTANISDGVFSNE